MVISRTDNIVKSLENSAYSKIIINYKDNKDYDVYSKDFEKNNYICLDQFSQFVVSSNIRITVKYLVK